MHALRTPSAALLLFIVASSSPTYAQQNQMVYVVVDFKRVEPGKAADYVAMEHDIWRPIHEQRIKGGRMLDWALYIPEYPGASGSDHDFITVNVYGSLKDVQDPLDDFQQLAEKAHPGKNLDELFSRGENVARTIGSELWVLADQTSPDQAGSTRPRFLSIAYMRSKPAEESYAQIEQSIWRPVNQELVRSGRIRSWGVYALLYPGGSEYPYDYAAVAAVDDLSTLHGSPLFTPELFQKVHPNKDFQDMMRRTLAARDLVHLRLWRMVDSATAGTTASGQ